MPGLLGFRPTRHFKIYREEFPAIFRFNGMLFQEFYDIDSNEHRWEEISEEEARRWLKAKKREDSIFFVYGGLQTKPVLNPVSQTLAEGDVADLAERFPTLIYFMDTEGELAKV